VNAEEEELGKGNLFATGLVAGGAVAGVVIAFLSGSEAGEKLLGKTSYEANIVHYLSQGGYFLLGAAFFAVMGWMLYKVALRKT
jgi:hypothetical protein